MDLPNRQLHSRRTDQATIQMGEWAGLVAGHHLMLVEAVVNLLVVGLGLLGQKRRQDMLKEGDLKQMAWSIQP